MKKVLVVGSLFAFSFPLRAQDSHDGNQISSSNEIVRKGFYFSGAVGPAFGTITGSDNSGTALNVKGTAVDIDLQVGGSIQDNLFLHGTILAKTIQSPTVNGTQLSNSYYFNESMVGIGVTKYFTNDFFLTGNVGFAKYSFEEKNTSFTTDGGLGVQVKAGKEWWVGRHWLLGIAIQYSHLNLTSNPGAGITEKWNGDRFGVLFHTSFIRIKSGG